MRLSGSEHRPTTRATRVQPLWDALLGLGVEDDEADRLDLAAGLTLHSRLACQAVVNGDVTVEVPTWSRNY